MFVGVGVCVCVGVILTVNEGVTDGVTVGVAVLVGVTLGVGVGLGAIAEADGVGGNAPSSTIVIEFV